jgi:hypothetical protein
MFHAALFVGFTHGICDENVVQSKKFCYFKRKERERNKVVMLACKTIFLCLSLKRSSSEEIQRISELAFEVTIIK